MEQNRQQRQVRCIPQAFQTREAGDDLYIDGYFAVFNEEYQLWDDVSEIIKPVYKLHFGRHPGAHQPRHELSARPDETRDSLAQAG